MQCIHLVKSMGHPGVFLPDPYPYLQIPVPMPTGAGFDRYGCGSCVGSQGDRFPWDDSLLLGLENTAIPAKAANPAVSPAAIPAAIPAKAAMSLWLAQLHSCTWVTQHSSSGMNTRVRVYKKWEYESTRSVKKSSMMLHHWVTVSASNLIPTTCKFSFLPDDVWEYGSSPDINVFHEAMPDPITKTKDCTCGFRQKMVANVG
jgi:hypothetical protein